MVKGFLASFVAATAIALGGCDAPDMGVTPDKLMGAGRPADRAVLKIERTSKYGVMEGAYEISTLGECLEQAASPIKHSNATKVSAVCYDGEEIVGAFECKLAEAEKHGRPYPADCLQTRGLSAPKIQNLQ